MSDRAGVVVSVEEAGRRAGAARAAGEVVVLCHGCFDIVHPGHVRHLQQARKLGSRLLVTVTSDAAMGKGAGRPFIPAALRAENVAALACVDWVAVCPHPTAEAVLRRVRPDVYVKGREYESNRDPRFTAERAVVRSYGGRVVFTSGEVVFSSTALGRARDARSAGVWGALEALLASFDGQRVLVVGETIRDTYVDCDHPTVAAEGPVMTLRPVSERRFDGGAAVVALHLAAMGARPTLLTALPASHEARSLAWRLQIAGADVHVIEVGGTILEKQRFLVGTTKVMKVDRAESLVLDAAARRSLHAKALDLARGCETAIIADYGLGLFTAPAISALCTGLRTRVETMAGDVSGRRSSLLAFRGVDLLCPTEEEARDALADHAGSLSAVAWHLLAETRAGAVIVSGAGEGLTAFERREEPDHEPDDDPADWSGALRAVHVPPLCRHAVDTLGCGDALLAAAALARGAGASLPDVAYAGSLAAAAEAAAPGNAVIGADDMRAVLESAANARPLHDQLCAADARPEPVSGPDAPGAG